MVTQWDLGITSYLAASAGHKRDKCLITKEKLTSFHCSNLQSWHNAQILHLLHSQHAEHYLDQTKSCAEMSRALVGYTHKCQMHTYNTYSVLQNNHFLRTAVRSLPGLEKIDVTPLRGHYLFMFTAMHWQWFLCSFHTKIYPLLQLFLLLAFG